MNPSDILRVAITDRTAALSAAIPADRPAALLAMVRTINNPSHQFSPHTTDAFTGIPVSGPGNSRALQLVLEASPNRGADPPDLANWAESMLEACGEIARAELVLAHTETGFMRLDVSRDGVLHAWIARSTPPARWREREDDSSWRTALLAGDSGTPLAYMRHQIDLPDTATVDGVEIGLARQVLTWLIECVPTAFPEGAPVANLVDDIAAALGASGDKVAHIVERLTLDAVNAAWHVAVPGIADAPIVRIDGDRLALSARGLTSEPLRFLARELRRRDADAYHTAAHQREQVFRDDLIALFGHRRFVSSPVRIELRREQGTIRTDIDAAVFDRKSGTLAVFELKAHEPYARSTTELERQQENVRYANRQVSGVLAWISRNGADEILSRIDRATAKANHVQKVQAFVLGRHVIDAGEGATLDKRATWATWPQVLRVLEGQPVEDLGRNPIATLAARLSRSAPALTPATVPAVTQIDLGSVSMQVFSSNQVRLEHGAPARS